MKERTRNMTTGRPAKLILIFAIPLLIGNFFQLLYNLADTLIVGRLLGVHSLAAVGSTGSVVFLIIGFTMGASNGLTLITSQRFGANDAEGVKRSVATGSVIIFALMIILTILSVTNTGRILQLMQTPPEIIEEAHLYLIIILSGLSFTVLFNYLSGLIRALGDSRTPLYYLIFGTLLNIGLVTLFISVFEMGVEGAAITTLMSQCAASVLCLRHILKNLPILHFQKRHLKLTWHEVKEHIFLAIPMAFQMSLIAIGNMLLQFVVNGLGAISIAAYAAAIRINQVAVFPLFSFGLSMGTYTAQNMGAKKYLRIKQGVKECALLSVGFALLIGSVNVLFGYRLSGLFVGGEAPEVLELAQTFLSVSGSFYIILSLLFVFRFTLQGMGKSRIPFISSLIELFMNSFAALFLGRDFGFVGVAWAPPLAWIGGVVPLSIAYMIFMRRVEKKQGL